MESWTISEDLLSALIEAAEAGVQIDSVYEGTAPQVLQKVEAEEEQEEEARAAQPTSATSMPVYRLAEGSLIHFSRDNKPISPPVQHLYVSRISHENCFGCELQMDAMVTDAPPHFKRGDILVFSTERKVENGDFVFLKTRVRDEFVQVFFGPEDLMRLRFLHPSHPERTLRRFEIKAMCRLIGRYQDL
jgi:hypothetical protein